MSAHLILDESGAEPVPAIPLSAVREEDGKTYVFVVDHGKAVKTEVRLGRINGEYAEVLQGLDEKRQIVHVGQCLLTDGTAVEIVE
jgi:multidrug efflux pump subunit AcrA (membrane-fusion protein)